MFPSFSSTNCGNRPLGYPKFSSNISTSRTSFSFVERSDFQNQIHCELGYSGIFPFGNNPWSKMAVMGFPMLVSLLIATILIIVSVGPQKQMVRPNAHSVVAAVENANAVRNIPSIYNPRGLVRSHVFSVYAHRSVAIGSAFCSRPIPAIIPNGDFFPEFKSQRFSALEVSVYFHEDKNRHPAKVMSAQSWPQLPDGGKEVLSLTAFWSTSRTATG